MKHIQKDFKVKMYIPWDFSANQNVVIVGDRNDEDRAVPSVIKLLETLFDEDVDEMIPETLTRHVVFSSPLTYQFLRSPTELWKLSHSTGEAPRTSHRTDRQHVETHTQSGVKKVIKYSQSPAASCEHTGCKDCLKARSSSELVNKS